VTSKTFGPITPPISRIVESSLYVEDLERAVAFYRDVLGLQPLDAGSSRLVAFDAGGATVLLLCKRGASAQGSEANAGHIPPHDGHGPTHLAFGTSLDRLDEWETHLRLHGVEIESRATWRFGGRSLYFRDPDGHSLELVTPGTWESY